MPLAELLGVRPGVTSVIGSGGKTSLIAALARELSGEEPVLPPASTVTGALCRYVAAAGTGFQPMNANFGLLPPVTGAGKKERKKCYHDIAVRDIMKFVSETAFRH